MLIDESRRLAIVTPIDDSVGIDGREDEGVAGDLLREIRSQRKALVRLEQSASMGDDLVVPEGTWTWEDLAENAAEYLSDHGKDLEPMAALLEAAVRTDDLAELAAAMGLLAELVETFWDQGLFPAEDDEGVETRYLPLSGLSGGSMDKDGALIGPLRRMLLARGGGHELRYLDKVKADAAMTASMSATDDQKTARQEEAESGYRQIQGAARGIPPASIARALALATAAEDGWRKAIGFISERTKPNFPSASRLSDELKSIREWLAGMAPGEVADAEAPPATDAAEPSAGGHAAPAAGAGSFVGGKITRREDALKAITLAADYFMLHEPLSPLGTSLLEVDRRARMSLHDLLTELIPDDSARQDFYWRSGIKPPAQKESDGYDE